MQDHSPLMHPEPGMAHLIPIVVETLIHTSERPFCTDWACGCHEDTALIQQHCGQYVEDGLMTTAEALRFMVGRTI